MIKGDMQNFIATSKKSSYYSERTLIPMLPSDTLLSVPRYQKIIGEIRQSLDPTEEEFNTLYRQLIDNFITFVQLLPSNHGGKLGSVLSEGLWRALLTLQLQKSESENVSHNINQDLAKDSDDNHDPLTRYLLFSAALLFGVGVVAYEYSVTISKEDGTFIQEWLPYQGAMQPSSGNYYQIRLHEPPSPWLKPYTTLLLAMPAVGFNWIVQDQDALNSWINLLLDQREPEKNKLKLCLERANEETRQITTLQQPSLPHHLSLITPEATSLAEEFLEWLEHGVKNNTIPVNNYYADIHLVKGGVFLETPTIIEKFCEQSLTKAKITVVLEQLEKIGLVNLNEPIKYRYLNPPSYSLFTPQPEKHPINQLNSNQPSNNGVPKKEPLKTNIREGLEIVALYFLSIFHKLNLNREENFHPDGVTEEDKKIAHHIKLRKRKRFKILLKEAEEALKIQQQLNLGKKIA